MYTTIEIPQVSLKIKQPLGLFIDNKFVKSSDGKKITSVNPATNKPIAEFYAASEKDIDRAVSAARKAYETTWSKTSPQERSDLLLKLVALLERDKNILAALDTLDAGKPYYNNSLRDLDEIIELTKFFSSLALTHSGGDVIPVGHEKYVYTLKSPYGVVAQIVPWNYPLAMASWKLQGALAAGNTVIIKPAENTSLSLLYFAQLIVEAGFPPGVVNVLPGLGNVVGSGLSQHKGVDKVSFTGSPEVGAKILEGSSKSNIKDVTLELGGKSPAVVFADCQLDMAVSHTIDGIFYNSGQNCTANSRIYVQEEIYDEFLKQFKAETKFKISFGKNFDPFDAQCTLGPVVSETQFKRIQGYITGEEAKKFNFEDNPDKWTMYQTLEYPTEKETKGFFIPPTIFTNVKQDSILNQREIFGPVVVINKFKDYSEALKLANDSMYGLAAMVFTENVRIATKFARDIDAGTVWINTSNEPEVSAPFGGFKTSGIGRELGVAGVETYLQTKAVHMNLSNS